MPCVALPVLLGVFGADVPAWLIAVLLAAVVAWQVVYRAPAPAFRAGLVADHLPGAGVFRSIGY